MMNFKKVEFIVLLFVLSGCNHLSDLSDVQEPSRETIFHAAMGEMCGGIAAIQCTDEKAYCALKPGQCQMPDAAGICTKITQICTREYRPVCGCDGKIYPTACVAQSAGINILKPSSGELQSCALE